MTKRPAVPKHLSARSQKIFVACTTPGPVSVGRALMIEECLTHLDRATEFREIVAREGVLKKGRRAKMAHLHPLAALAEREQHAFERLALRLSIHWSSVDAGLGDPVPDNRDPELG